MTGLMVGAHARHRLRPEIDPQATALRQFQDSHQESVPKLLMMLKHR
jgi:hypothetical protein